MAHRTAYNPSDGPLVIDDDGRTIGGRTWAPVDGDADRVRRHVKAGRLLLVDDAPADDANPDAVAAWRRMEKLNAAGGKAAARRTRKATDDEQEG